MRYLIVGFGNIGKKRAGVLGKKLAAQQKINNFILSNFFSKNKKKKFFFLNKIILKKKISVIPFVGRSKKKE